jgi:uncharacterized protein YgiM (DUF1202 family)
MLQSHHSASSEPSDRSEIVSQILFGEHFEILEKNKQWSKVKMQYDDYEAGLIPNKYSHL